MQRYWRGSSSILRLRLMSELELENLLLPRPRRIVRTNGEWDVTGLHQQTIDSSIGPPEAYRLSISRMGATSVASDMHGRMYAQQTFSQLRRLFGRKIPAMHIEDWPDFPVRGVMLDVSRDKVPTMATLKSLIDKLASWKINQLQLYIEHTFAYKNHEDVWRDASPFTAQEIDELNWYCYGRQIELVPNQNSFGHMERWLKHPRYLPLAEAPDGAPTPWGFDWKGPFSLCPTDPRSIELLAELYAELLPNFVSKLFNVGCDETFDIGHGRSAQQCKERGRARVYVDFLKQVHGLVKMNGRQMMFWGDIIKEHPEMIGELEGAIGLVWGYEADSPFDKEASAFAKAGVPFYVCPGTSSWCSIAGRTHNMIANAKSAAKHGLAHGAAGYLMTDWGDHGHLQYLPVSYAGFAAGAAFSWCLESNRDLPLADVLDVHAFGDDAKAMGKLAVDFGNVYQATGKFIPNASSLFRILVPPPTPKQAAAGNTLQGINAAEVAIDAAMEHLPKARMNTPDAALVADEFRNAAAILKFACDMGRRELNCGNRSANKMSAIVAEHGRLWFARNRPGGLEDSVRRLENAARELAD
jgi:hexosaminidase